MTALQRLLPMAGKPSTFGVDHLAGWLVSVSPIERLVLSVMLTFPEGLSASSTAWLRDRELPQPTNRHFEVDVVIDLLKHAVDEWPFVIPAPLERIAKQLQRLLSSPKPQNA